MCALLALSFAGNQAHAAFTGTGNTLINAKDYNDTFSKILKDFRNKAPSPTLKPIDNSGNEFNTYDFAKSTKKDATCSAGRDEYNKFEGKPWSELIASRTNTDVKRAVEAYWWKS